MPSQKVTEHPTLVTPAGPDLVYVIDDVAGTPTGKKITLDSFFSQIPSNTAVNGTFSVSGNTTLSGANTKIDYDLNVSGTATFNVVKTSSNGVIITNSLTPANSSVTGIPTGKLFWDANYLYVRVSNTTIKRVALSAF